MSSSSHWDFGDRLTRARTGGEPLGEFLNEYWNYLVILIAPHIGRRLGRKFEPEDLVQQTFLTATKRFADFERNSEGEWLTWLQGIAAQCFIDELRRQYADKRDYRLEQDIAAELDRSSRAIDRCLLDKGTSPSEQTARRERAVLVANGLAQLPADYRVVLVGFMNGETPADIAAGMGKTTGAIQKLRLRGFEALGKLLEGLE